MTTLRRADRLLALASFVGVLVPAVPAAADIISDEESECRDKTAGDACSLEGKAGLCAKSTCSRNDYSDGPPPKQKQVECMVCQPGATKAASEPAATEPAPASDTKAGATAKGCGSARIGEPSLAIGSSVLGIALLGLALRRRP
jgi:hypothetical protein